MIGDGLAPDLLRLAQAFTCVFPGVRDPLKPKDNCRKALNFGIRKSGVLRYGPSHRLAPKFGRTAFTSSPQTAGTGA
jgi:hypothetical protein